MKPGFTFQASSMVRRDIRKILVTYAHFSAEGEKHMSINTGEVVLTSVYQLFSCNWGAQEHL